MRKLTSSEMSQHDSNSNLQPLPRKALLGVLHLQLFREAIDFVRLCGFHCQHFQSRIHARNCVVYILYI